MSLFDDKRCEANNRNWANRRERIRAWKAAGRPTVIHFTKPDITFPVKPKPDHNNPEVD
jgi:hypothetical protein